MSTTEIISALLTLTAGIGVFLIACTVMSTNLESISSNRLRALFSNAAKNRILGVGIGTVGTMLIQSSGAMSVMVIGFVNAGIMSLTQAVTVIFGANIGTTITGQIVALGMFGSGISTSVMFSSLAGIGALLSMFAKKDVLKNVGGILTGFGLLFVGIEMMSDSMGSFVLLESVKLFLSGIDHSVLLVLIGTVLTAIIQSSSVTTSITITMVVSGLLSLEQGIFLVVGSNIGACVVAVIACLTSCKNAKRATFIHVLFNIGGAILFLFADFVIFKISGGNINTSYIFASLFPDAPQTQLAMFHTCFNIAKVIIMLPMTNLLIRLSVKIIPGKEASVHDTGDMRLYFVDDHMLRTPAVAVQQVKNEILNMANIAISNFKISLNAICQMDDSHIDEFRRNENELNYLSKELVHIIVKLSKLSLSESDYIYLSTTYHTIADLERIGDYAENIIEYADSLKSLREGFSQDALNEICEVEKMVEELYGCVMDVYNKPSLSRMEDIDAVEERIDSATGDMAKKHIARLNKNICSFNVGAQYLSLASNIERIADHLVNIAQACCPKSSFSDKSTFSKNDRK